MDRCLGSRAREIGVLLHDAATVEGSGAAVQVSATISLFEMRRLSEARRDDPEAAGPVAEPDRQ